MKRVLLLASIWVLCAGWSLAQVRVAKTAGQKSALDLSGLQYGSAEAERIFKQTLERNLDICGWFVRVAPGRGEYAVSGNTSADGAIKAVVRLTETASKSSLLAKSYRADAEQARRLAHQVADDIIEAVTGKPGLFGGRLVVVGQRGGHKELYLCDADGGGLIQLTRDRSISLAPRWSPDGETIVYTSYLGGFPDVYSIHVPSGKRARVAGFPGLNTGGAISPNGREMALILSKDGNPDLYIMDMRSRQLTRITNTPRAAEASPAWSPDGRQIVYVSDAPGTPQLFIVGRDGSAPRRMTGRVAESVNPDWGANGLIVYSARLGGRYQVCVLNPQTGESRQITSENADYETPSWAPDGRHVVCSRTSGYKASIYLLDTLGDAPVALLDYEGNWYSPRWAPK
jgi:TolB protein